MPQALQLSSVNALTESEATLSFLRDRFEQFTLFTLLPESFKGLLPQNPTDLLNVEQDLHRILSQEALKKTAKDTEQANVILAKIPELHISGINFDKDLFCNSKSEQPKCTEGMAQKPELFKENINPSEHFPHNRIRREGTGRVSSRRPFTLNSSSFGSDINVQKDPRALEDVYEFFAAADRQETAAAIIRKLRGENSPVAFSSQQSLKRRVRREGTGRRKNSKNFDWKLLGNTEKYMQLDDEKLEVEEEDPMSSFMSGAEEACEMLIETRDRITNKGVLIQEPGHEECPSEMVNVELQYHKDIQLDSNSQNCKQAHYQHSMANGSDIDGIQLNPVQEKETLCASETEETVNMPPKIFTSFGNSSRNALDQLLKDYTKLDVDNTNSMPFSRSGHEINDIEKSFAKAPSETEETVNIPPEIFTSFGNSSRNALDQLLKHYKKLDADNTNSVPFSRSGHEINDIEKSFAKALECDTKYALQQSQTESSNTIHSQSLFADEGKTSMQPQQFPKDFHLEDSDRTPHENFSQKPTETSTPVTSPTPPSKISAAFLLHRKLKNGIEDKIGDANKPPRENRDEEAAKIQSSSPSHCSGRLHTSLHSHISGSLQNSSASHSSRRLNTSSPPHSSRRLNTSSPSHISRKLSLISPLKKRESSGVRRLSFDSSSMLTKQDGKKDGFDSGESVNDAKVMDVVNPSKYSEQNDKGEMETTDLDMSNLTGLNPQKNTPLMGIEVQNFNTLVPECMEKDGFSSASGERIEEVPITLHKKNVKKAKRQSKNNSIAGASDVHEKDTTIPNEVMVIKRKNKKSDYERRQSLTGAGTLWKSGVRRSTRIRSRPLEFWRGERFLYGRIHKTLTTVIGIKYSSPLNGSEKSRDVPKFKVESYVEDKYSHLVEFAASY